LAKTQVLAVFDKMKFDKMVFLANWNFSAEQEKLRRAGLEEALQSLYATLPAELPIKYVFKCLKNSDTLFDAYRYNLSLI
jgi:hypothetical protein